MGRAMRNNRTHRNEMDQADIERCEAFVKARNQWVLGDYAMRRMTERGVTEGDMALTIHDGNLAEINETQGLCVVMRKEFQAGYSVCVVINSTTGFIITTWKNKKRDPRSLFDMTKFFGTQVSHEKSDCQEYWFPKGEYVRS